MCLCKCVQIIPQLNLEEYFIYNIFFEARLSALTEDCIDTKDREKVILLSFGLKKRCFGFCFPELKSNNLCGEGCLLQ